MAFIPCSHSFLNFPYDSPSESSNLLAQLPTSPWNEATSAMQAADLTGWEDGEESAESMGYMAHL